MKCWTNIPLELSTPEGLISAIKNRKVYPEYDPTYYEGISKYA
jgi:hypothetical protein